MTVFSTEQTAGLLVEVFQDDILYADPIDWACYQDHRFRCVLSDVSRIPPYYGDVDGDGELELYLAAEVTNNSGAPGTPQLYRIFRWRDNTFHDTGEVSESALMAKGERFLKPL